MEKTNKLKLKEVPSKVKYLMILWVITFFIIFLMPKSDNKEININVLKANTYFVLTDYHKNGAFNSSSIKSKEILHVYKSEEKLLKMYIEDGENSVCTLLELETGESKSCNF